MVARDIYSIDNIQHTVFMMFYASLPYPYLGSLVHELLIDGQMLSFDPVTAVDKIAFI
jgi:hypothetical protein